jgi:hypothetical protein
LGYRFNNKEDWAMKRLQSYESDAHFPHTVAIGKFTRNATLVPIKSKIPKCDIWDGTYEMREDLRLAVWAIIVASK